MTQYLKIHWDPHQIEWPRHNSKSFILFFFFGQIVRCLVLLSFLIDPYNGCWANAPKPDGFKALGVETSLRAY
jgi:hypothetical protein